MQDQTTQVLLRWIFEAQDNGLSAAQKQIKAQLQELDVYTRNAALGMTQYDTEVSKAADAIRRSNADFANLQLVLSKTHPELGQTAEKTNTLRDAMQRGVTGVEGFSRGLASGALNFSLLAGGAVIAGREVAQFVTDSVGKFQELEQAVANIATIQPEVDTSKLFQQLSELQTQIPATSKQLADSYYNIASSISLSAEDTLALTEKTALGARAALADTDKWAAAVTGVMNTYGYTLKDVDHIQDVFFLTVKNGVITGEQLASSFGPVAQAGKDVGQSFESVAAGAAAITKEGGNVQDNMTKLKDVYEDLGTSRAKQGLHDLGIEVTDQLGNYRAWYDILGDLKAKLEQLPQGAQADVLNEVFSNKRSREGALILMNELDSINAYFKQNVTDAGASEAAVTKMMDTSAARAEKLKGRIEALQEQWGQYLDVVRDVSAFTETDLSKSMADWANKLGASMQLLAAMRNGPLGGPASSIAGGINDIGQFATGLMGYQPPEPPHPAVNTSHGFDQAQYGPDSYVKTLEQTRQDVQRAMTGIDDAVAQGISLANGTLIDEAKIGPEAYQQTVNQAKAQIDAALKGMQDSFDTWASAAQNDMGNVGDTTFRETQRMIGDMARARKAAEDAKAALDASVKSQTQLDVNAATDKNNQAAQVDTAKANDPAYIQSVINAKKASAQASEAEQQAEKAAGLITETNAEREKRLADEQAARQAKAAQDAQIAINQKAAEKAQTDKLTAAQDNLNQVTSYYDGVLKGIDATISQLRRDEAAALGESDPRQLTGLAAALKQDASDIQLMSRLSQQALDAIDKQLYLLDKSTRTLAQDTQRALEPYAMAAQAATQALDDIAKHTEYVDRQFEETAHGIETQMGALEDAFKGPIGAAQASVNGYQQALSALAHEEALALRPMQDAQYNLNLQLQEEQDRLRDITAQYDAKLIPMQAELNRLREEDRQAQAQADLHNQKTSIENLKAQLATATGDRAAAIQAQLSQLEGQYARSERENQVQTNIAEVTAQRDQAVRAEQQKIDAINREIEAQSRLEAQERRRYELEQRQIQDNLYDAQQRLDALNNEYNSRKAILEAAAQKNERDRADFDYAQSQLTTLAKETSDWANEQLAVHRDILAALTSIPEQSRQALQNERTDRQQADKEWMAGALARQQSDQSAYNDIKNHYESEIAYQGTVKTQYGDIATAAENSAKTQVDDINKVIAALRSQYDWENAVRQAKDKGATAPGDTSTTAPDGSGTWPQQPPTQGGTPPHKAMGGPVDAYHPYLVGEVGPELFVPRSSGTIVPTSALMAPVPVAASGTGGGDTYHFNAPITIKTPLPQTPAELSRFYRLIGSQGARTTRQTAVRG